jgi:hypothetical protein
MSKQERNSDDKGKIRQRRCCQQIIILLAVTVVFAVPLLGQSDKPVNNGPQDLCRFNVKQMDRTPQTSQELVQLESRLVNPEVAVTQQLIRELAAKAASDTDPVLSAPAQAASNWRVDRAYTRKYDEAVARYLDILVYVVSQKEGEVRAESFATVVENQFLRALPMQPSTQRCFQKAAAEIFPTLPFEKQWGILISCDSCSLFRSPALTSYWEQLYESLETHIEETPPGEIERDLRFYRTGILKRIYEADPTLGRKMILQEIASPQPRCDIDALKILPDETLPSMDAPVAQQLPGIYANSNWYEYEAKLAVIERYATGSILPEMKLLYSNDLDERNQYHVALFLSYFLRTEPGFGKELIEHHLKGPARDDVLFTDLDKVRAQPALQELARQHLGDPDKAVAANAAYIFKYGGSSSVEPLLWQHLESWHKQWSGKQGPIPYEEQNYQDSLVEALLFGSGPCRTRDTLERLRVLYIKGQSVDGNIELPDWRTPIRIHLQDITNNGPKFDVDFCSGSLTLAQLKSALPRFPKGTEFEWYPAWSPSLDERFESSRREIDRLIEGLGMTVQTHIEE